MKKIEQCDNVVIHEEIVKKVEEQMKDEAELLSLADLYKVFADSSRIKILWALSVSELCVCDLAVVVKMTQSAVSHQLRVLKQAKLVKSRRDGKVVYYSLDDDHVHQIIALGLEHVLEK
jgi:ArsR family transcriptional regulator